MRSSPDNSGTTPGSEFTGWFEPKPYRSTATPPISHNESTPGSRSPPDCSNLPTTYCRPRPYRSK